MARQLTKHKIKEFSGHGGAVFPHNGVFRAVIYDFGPNVCAAGDGATEQEAIANMRPVKYGYSLRFDFLTRPLHEERRTQIAAWFSTLTVDQLEMLSDFIEAARK